MPDSSEVFVPAASAASTSAAAIASLTSAGVPVVGVGRRAWPSTLCLASTSTVWIFVPPRSTPPRLAMPISVSCRGRCHGEQLLEQREVLEQVAHGGAVGGEVGGVVEQDAALAVHDLVLDPADSRSDDGLRLPHALGDR